MLVTNHVPEISHRFRAMSVWHIHGFVIYASSYDLFSQDAHALKCSKGLMWRHSKMASIRLPWLWASLNSIKKMHSLIIFSENVRVLEAQDTLLWTSRTQVYYESRADRNQTMNELPICCRMHLQTLLNVCITKKKLVDKICPQKAHIDTMLIKFQYLLEKFWRWIKNTGQIHNNFTSMKGTNFGWILLSSFSSVVKPYPEWFACFRNKCLSLFTSGTRNAMFHSF